MPKKPLMPISVRVSPDTIDRLRQLAAQGWDSGLLCRMGINRIVSEYEIKMAKING